jgi:galactose oxidase-like protein
VMSSVRKSHTATLLRSGQVLLAGGITNDGPPFAVSTSADVFDPASNTFSLAVGRMTPRCAHTATLLPDGKVLLTGGQNGGPNLLLGFSNSAEIYNPETGLFQPVLGVLSDVRSLHAASPLADGRVLVTGGCCTYPAPVVVKSADVFDPSDIAVGLPIT